MMGLAGWHVHWTGTHLSYAHTPEAGRVHLQRCLVRDTNAYPSGLLLQRASYAMVLNKLPYIGKREPHGKFVATGGGGRGNGICFRRFSSRML